MRIHEPNKKGLQASGKISDLAGELHKLRIRMFSENPSGLSKHSRVITNCNS